MKRNWMMGLTFGILTFLALGLVLLRARRLANGRNANGDTREADVTRPSMPIARPQPLDPAMTLRREVADTPANGSAADGSAADGSAADGSAADGSAADGSAADGPAQAAPRGASRATTAARVTAVVAFALLVLGAALVARGQFAWGAGGATVRVDSASVSAGGSVVVGLDALNVPAPGLAAITIDVQYDNTVIEATACAPNPGGALDSALCNSGYTANKVRVTGMDAAGAPGAIALAKITFRAVGQPGRCSALDVQIVTFADPNGQPISVTAQDGQVCIPGPTTTPTPRPTTSPQPTASPTPGGTQTAVASSTPGASHTATSASSATPTPTPEESPLISAAMAVGWNFKCYVGASGLTEEALAEATGKISAAYRLGDAGLFDRWFPNRPDVGTLTTVNPGDALFLLTSDPFVWTQAASDAESTVTLTQGWNGVCYWGESGPVEEAIQGIDGPYAVIYSLAPDQTWQRWVPSKPEASNLSQLAKSTPVLILVTGKNGHWDFSP